MSIRKRFGKFVGRRAGLVKDFGLYSITTFGASLVSFLLLPLYTRLLTKEDYGYLEVVHTTIALGVPLLSAQIGDAAFRLLLKEDGGKRGPITISIGFSSAMALLILGASFAAQQLNESPRNWLLPGALFAITMVSTLLSQILRGLNALKTMAVAGIGFSVLFGVLNIVFIAALDFGAEGMLLAGILAHSASITYSCLGGGIYKWIHFKEFTWRMLKGMLRYSLPLLPGVLGWWAMSTSDRYQILLFLDQEQLAVYGVAAKLATIVYVGNSVLYKTLQAHIIRFQADEEAEKEFSSLFKLVVLLQSFGLLLIGTLGPILIPWYVGDAYATAWRYTVLLTFAAALWFYGALISIFFQRKMETSALGITSICGALVNVTVNFLLLSRIGLWGAVLAGSLGFLTVLLIRGAMLRARYSTKTPFGLILMYGILFVPGSCAAISGDRYATAGLYGVALCLLFLFNMRRLKLALAALRPRALAH